MVSALAINAVTFAAVVFAYARLPPTRPETCLPAERFVTAIRSGLRFTRESPELKATLVRSAAFFLFASAYLALLPLIARNQLAAGASGFGILFAGHGAGAVLGALFLPYVRQRVTPDQLVLGGGLAAAAMTAMLAQTSHMAVAFPIVLITGAGSLAIMSTLMLSAQVALPSWVKARGLAVVQMVLSGAITLGSLVWGALADRHRNIRDPGRRSRRIGCRQHSYRALAARQRKRRQTTRLRCIGRLPSSRVRFPTIEGRSW